MDARSRKHAFIMKGLTQRQQEILEFIETEARGNGFWPSIREIQERFGFRSTNAVMGHLRALERKGYIGRIPGQARTFRILNPEAAADEDELPPGAEELVDLPVFGAIAAGYPDRVEAGGEIGTLQVGLRTVGDFRRNRSFALQVRGESMMDANIHEGDMVIVEPREPRDGDIVAALIDGETTLKRYVQKEADHPYLKAENRNYPELYPVTELTIQGVAKAVVRSL